MKNIRGFIDPISLGFLLTFIGTTTVVVTHDDTANEIVSTAITQSVSQQVVDTDTKNNFNK
ncbi:hypothetical protein MNBD_GAMMA07-827 [hydrothermal vent metagenome]|uniref:Uncharacterized protein n=1 Tax=hydrothermal vent metagenome TaxID=652676 RepID=A0A3B0X0M3_9ZZZZ